MIMSRRSVQTGDILVVRAHFAGSDGYFGDLLATSLQARGVQELIIDPRFATSRR